LEMMPSCSRQLLDKVDMLSATEQQFLGRQNRQSAGWPAISWFGRQRSRGCWRPVHEPSKDRKLHGENSKTRLAVRRHFEAIFNFKEDKISAASNAMTIPDLHCL
jgi:hypothetical protein